MKMTYLKFKNDENYNGVCYGVSFVRGKGKCSDKKIVDAIIRDFNVEDVSEAKSKPVKTEKESD